MTQGRSEVRIRTRKIVLGVATIVSALALAGPAQASTAAGDQYGAVLGEQSGGNGQGAGGLPFTGLNLLLVAGVGTALTAGGMVIRRTASRATPRPPA
jgi:hypothetical protein